MYTIWLDSLLISLQNDLFSPSLRSFENCENDKNKVFFGVGEGDETFVI